MKQDTNSIANELKSIANLKRLDEKLSRIMSQSDDEKVRNLARRISTSGSIIEIDEKNGRIKRLNLSHVRTENLTAHRNQQKMAAKFYNNCDVLQEKYPENIFLSLTLTIKHCNVDELSMIIDKLNESWTKFINTPQFSPYFNFKGKYYKECGYFKVLEIGSSTEFNKINPHLHCILHIHKSFLHSKNYVSNEKLLKIWKKSLGISIDDDYQISVHIKKIKEKKDKSITQQCAYFGSYSIKTIDLSQYNLYFIESYINQIDRRNLNVFCGTMQKIINSKRKIDNTFNNENENSEYYLYKNKSYCKMQKD